MNHEGNNLSPDGFIAVPPGDPPRAHLDTHRREPPPLADVLAPTWALLRVERGAPAKRGASSSMNSAAATTGSSRTSGISSASRRNKSWAWTSPVPCSAPDPPGG
jgi:hypothetical protein